MTKTKMLNILDGFASSFSSKIDSVFVRKENGKGLSSNDFTTALKEKLEAMSGSGSITKSDIVSALGYTPPSIENMEVTNQDIYGIINGTYEQSGTISSEFTEITNDEVDAIINGTFIE